MNIILLVNRNWVEPGLNVGYSTRVEPTFGCPCENGVGNLPCYPTFFPTVPNRIKILNFSFTLYSTHAYIINHSYKVYCTYINSPEEILSSDFINNKCDD